MDLLIKIGLLFAGIGISSLVVHLFLDVCTIIKIKRWLKKYKQILLKDEDILDKYNSRVINSGEYQQVKELYDENLLLVKNFARIGLNYVDFIFFQELIGEYQRKAMSSSEANDTFNILKKLIWIIFLFETSLFTKKVGYYMTKLSFVYFVVLYIYKKF